MDTKPHFIAECLAEIRDRITRAEQAYHRPPHAVTLLAVSKAQPEQSLRAAYKAGQRCFGESYLQEASAKMTALADLAIDWHFIGRMQANKTRQIAESFSWVHGVDRLKIAQRLSDQRPGHLPPLNICLQIKLSDEPTKSGADPDTLLAMARDITKLTGTRLRGLSVIPEPTSNFAAQRKVFGILRAAAERLADDGITIDTLSMGMSDDFEAAIAEGATIVRVGAAIFGERRITSGDGLVCSD
ncbi:MAG: hypothetical protein FD165_2100 [Gammaproteobacteria bacterium]|nr:MAG: hypothetical protein FD165_2100 [Gammaproteobacteria bacterium]TND03451.1 MAG: hypothetical protein FD120_1846 [Gammaproteobacteria bacterium]